MSDKNYETESSLIQVEFDLNTDDEKLTTQPVRKIPVSDPAGRVDPASLMLSQPELQHASRKDRVNHKGNIEAFSYTAVFPRELLDEWYSQHEDDEVDMDDVEEMFAEMCVPMYNVVSENEVESVEELIEQEGLEPDDEPTENREKGDQE